jgi:hypothetical protein
LGEKGDEGDKKDKENPAVLLLADLYKGSTYKIRKIVNLQSFRLVKYFCPTTIYWH